MTVITACGEEKSIEPRLSEDKLVEIYVHLALIKNSDAGNAEKKAASLDYLRSEGVTKEELDERIDYYREEPERWRGFYSKVKVRLEEMGALRI